ncbi:DUF6188 family protein [Halochromatium glycolicum]|uniref:DUF6188 family protein n=1 Tax=Halochromatium glycolicum TaxID=85075 RepID=UPI00190CD555|nr:DUF6188 family protein [Halochromatium glycolicum]
MTEPFDFSWMVGREIAVVQLSEPDQWVFGFEASVGIGAECPWRILKNGVIAISSEDHKQQYGLAAPLDAAEVAAEILASHAISQVEVREGTADLVIKFSGGLRLEVIPISSGYESWGITAPSGYQVVAQGGGELSGWSK